MQSVLVYVSVNNRTIPTVFENEGAWHKYAAESKMEVKEGGNGDMEVYRNEKHVGYILYTSMFLDK
jgi:hypothetical protein